MGSRVFISYRHSDNPAAAGRLCDRLAGMLGSNNVFFDIETIQPGEDFHQVIREAIEKVDVVLVVMGGGFNPRRLFDCDDYVRMEVTEALRQRKRLIPVLLDETPMLDEQQVPADLRSLCSRRAARLRHETFGRDVATLISGAMPSVGRRSGQGLPDGLSQGADTPATAQRSPATTPGDRLREGWQVAAGGFLFIWWHVGGSPFIAVPGVRHSTQEGSFTTFNGLKELVDAGREFPVVLSAYINYGRWIGMIAVIAGAALTAPWPPRGLRGRYLAVAVGLISGLALWLWLAMRLAAKEFDADMGSGGKVGLVGYGMVAAVMCYQGITQRTSGGA